jgi:hypothetical protein
MTDEAAKPEIAEVELSPAEARLRAFEDEKLGENAVRINGKIERGFGSKFRELPEADQEQYAKLERLIEAERKVDDARAALAVAEAEYADAEKAAGNA